MANGILAHNTKIDSKSQGKDEEVVGTSLIILPVKWVAKKIGWWDGDEATWTTEIDVMIKRWWEGRRLRLSFEKFSRLANEAVEVDVYPVFYRRYEVNNIGDGWGATVLINNTMIASLILEKPIGQDEVSLEGLIRVLDEVGIMTGQIRQEIGNSGDIWGSEDAREWPTKLEGLVLSSLGGHWTLEYRLDEDQSGLNEALSLVDNLVSLGGGWSDGGLVDELEGFTTDKKQEVRVGRKRQRLINMIVDKLQERYEVELSEMALTTLSKKLRHNLNWDYLDGDWLASWKVNKLANEVLKVVNLNSIYLVHNFGEKILSYNLKNGIGGSDKVGEYREKGLDVSEQATISFHALSLDKASYRIGSNQGRGGDDIQAWIKLDKVLDRIRFFSSDTADQGNSYTDSLGDYGLSEEEFLAVMAADVLGRMSDDDIWSRPSRWRYLEGIVVGQINLLDVDRWVISGEVINSKAVSELIETTNAEVLIRDNEYNWRSIDEEMVEETNEEQQSLIGILRDMGDNFKKWGWGLSLVLGEMIGFGMMGVGGVVLRIIADSDAFWSFNPWLLAWHKHGVDLALASIVPLMSGLGFLATVVGFSKDCTVSNLMKKISFNAGIAFGSLGVWSLFWLSEYTGLIEKTITVDQGHSIGGAGDLLAFSVPLIAGGIYLTYDLVVTVGKKVVGLVKENRERSGEKELGFYFNAGEMVALSEKYPDMAKGDLADVDGTQMSLISVEEMRAYMSQKPETVSDLATRIAVQLRQYNIKAYLDNTELFLNGGNKQKAKEQLKNALKLAHLVRSQLEAVKEIFEGNSMPADLKREVDRLSQESSQGAVEQIERQIEELGDTGLAEKLNDDMPGGKFDLSPIFLFQVGKIGDWSTMFLGKADVARYVEDPLVVACEDLFDKNIQTLSSSANMSNIKDGKAFIWIDFESLSEENKKIAKNLFELSEYNGAPAVYVDIPINRWSLVSTVSKKARKLVDNFKMQSLTWVPSYTLKELQLANGDADGNISDPEEWERDLGYYYDKESKRFYLSRELFEKLDKVVEIDQLEVSSQLEVDDGVNLWLETAPEEIEVSLGDNKDRLVVQVPEREGVWTEGDFGDLVEAELTRQNIEASRGQIYVDWLDYERQSQETVMRFKFD